MPLYNATGTVELAIMSIINQTFHDWELIVLDDGSTDQGPDLVKSIKDPRIRFFQDPVNRGISYRLNKGIDLAHGKYFARMDSDDIAFPQRLEKQFDYLKNNPEVDLLATGILFFDNNGHAKGVMPVKETHKDICSTPWNGFYMPHPTWMGRIEWFKSNRYRSIADKAEDQDLLFRTYQTSCFACLPDILLGYRQDHRSFSKLFKARRVLAKSIVKTAIAKNKFNILCFIIVITFFKIIADFFNLYLGFDKLRNKLCTIPSDTKLEWQKIHQSFIGQLEKT